MACLFQKSFRRGAKQVFIIDPLKCRKRHRGELVQFFEGRQRTKGSSVAQKFKTKVQFIDFSIDNIFLDAIYSGYILVLGQAGFYLDFIGKVTIGNIEINYCIEDLCGIIKTMNIDLVFLEEDQMLWLKKT